MTADGFGSATLWLIAAFDYASFKGLEKLKDEIQCKPLYDNKQKQLGTLFMSQQQQLI